MKRIKKSRRLSCFLLFSTILTFTFTSCSTTPERSRGSLSDAMEKANPEYEGSRRVPDAPREPAYTNPPNKNKPGTPIPAPTPEYPSNSRTDPSSDPTGVENEPLGVWLGLRGGNSYKMTSQMDSYFDGDIFLGMVLSNHIEVDFFAGLKAAFAVKGSDLDGSVKDTLTFLKAGGGIVYTPFPKMPVFSPYISTGLGGFIMFWDFETPLYADSQTITNDSLGGVQLYVGAGLYLINLQYFRIGLGVSPETFLFGLVTSEGFDNDYFDYVSNLKYSLEAAIFFD